MLSPTMHGDNQVMLKERVSYATESRIEHTSEPKNSKTVVCLLNHVSYG